MLLWLAHIGQKLLLWGVLGAISLAGATLILNVLQLVVCYVQAWLHMWSLPTIDGAYPLIGHMMLLKLDSKGKGPCAQARRIPTLGPWASARARLAGSRGAEHLPEPEPQPPAAPPAHPLIHQPGTPRLGAGCWGRNPPSVGSQFCPVSPVT